MGDNVVGLGAVPRLIEQYVAGLRRLVYVRGQTIEVLDCGSLDFVHHIIVE